MAGYDWDVIERSLPYLFREGMTFSVTLTLLATRLHERFVRDATADWPWPDAVVRVYSRDELKQHEMRERLDDDRVGFLADGEEPVREIRLNPFWIDPVAVTNERFAAFVAATGYRTVAEREGWSFVFAGLLPDDFPPTRRVAQAFGTSDRVGRHGFGFTLRYRSKKSNVSSIVSFSSAPAQP